jgi:hypothetical protein
MLRLSRAMRSVPTFTFLNQESVLLQFYVCSYDAA